MTINIEQNGNIIKLADLIPTGNYQCNNCNQCNRFNKHYLYIHKCFHIVIKDRVLPSNYVIGNVTASYSTHLFYVKLKDEKDKFINMMSSINENSMTKISFILEGKIIFRYLF